MFKLMTPQLKKYQDERGGLPVSRIVLSNGFETLPRSKAQGHITQSVAQEALEWLQVDEAGFDEMDRKILLTIIEKFKGGPVGIEALAAAIQEEKSTLEDVHEPYLLQSGYLDRTARGRQITQKTLKHFGKRSDLFSINI